MARNTTAHRHGLQPSKGTDCIPIVVGTAPAVIEVNLCELGEAKSAPADLRSAICEPGEYKSVVALNTTGRSFTSFRMTSTIIYK